MGDYIEREDAMKAVTDFFEPVNTVSAALTLNGLLKKLNSLTPADVVEVVRCGECIHNYGVKANCEFNPHDIVCDWWSTDGMDETDFCSRGERRSE